MIQGLQHSIWNNRLKTWLLIFLLPLFLGIALFAVFYSSWWKSEVYDEYGNTVSYQEATSQERLAIAEQATGEVLVILGPILIIWILIAFFFQRQLIFSFSGAKPITRQENPEIYNIVENLCISRGLPTPKIWIIDQVGMNAFALGRRASDSRIVFTTGLLERLDKREIEAVAAHELTHIINKDTLLMLVMVLYIGAISIIGEILLRTGRWKGGWKAKNMLPLVGLVLIILWYFLYPLIRLAISRKREYLADAGSVQLTKDNQAMISALKKISQKPEVSLYNKEMAAMFTANPLDWGLPFFQTHPSIEDRIKALENY